LLRMAGRYRLTNATGASVSIGQLLRLEAAEAFPSPESTIVTTRSLAYGTWRLEEIVPDHEHSGQSMSRTLRTFTLRRGSAAWLRIDGIHVGRSATFTEAKSVHWRRVPGSSSVFDVAHRAPGLDHCHQHVHRVGWFVRTTGLLSSSARSRWWLWPLNPGVAATEQSTDAEAHLRRGEALAGRMNTPKRSLSNVAIRLRPEYAEACNDRGIRTIGRAVAEIAPSPISHGP